MVASAERRADPAGGARARAGRVRRPGQRPRPGPGPCRPAVAGRRRRRRAGPARPGGPRRPDGRGRGVRAGRRRWARAPAAPGCCCSRSALALVGAAVHRGRPGRRPARSTRPAAWSRPRSPSATATSGVRVEPTGPRELAEAGYAFNRMADRLVAARTDERELVADLSHRLRTPLTVLRLDAEALDSDDTSVGSFSPAELDRRRGDPADPAGDRHPGGRDRRADQDHPQGGRARGRARRCATSARWSGTGWCSGRRWPATRTGRTGSSARSCGSRCRCRGPSWPPRWTR